DYRRPRGTGAFTPYGLATYGFSYTSESVPHLTQIQNWLANTEQYNLQFSSQSLFSPIDASSQGTTQLLTGISITNLGAGHTFTYGTGGELATITTPLGGTLGWTYGTPTYQGNIQIREARA